MKVICVYHSADTDGRVSAGIVKQAYPNEPVEFIPSNYGSPTNIRVDKDTTIIIVDFSFDIEYMRKLQMDAKELIWIDHHPVIEQYKAQGFDPPGLRAMEHSAAYYCWKYFFPKEEVPQYVIYTSDYDTWQHKFKESMAFNAAMINEPIFNINSYSWSRLTDDNYLTYLLNNGNRILEFNKFKNQQVKDHIFETTVKGNKAVAINMRNTNSTIFEICDYKNYKVMMTFGIYSYSTAPRVSLYATDDTVDVGKIAEEMGGGGHAGAAGFISLWENLPLCQPSPYTIANHIKPVLDILEQDAYLREIYFKECSKVYRSQGANNKFMNREIIAVNHPLWAPNRSNFYASETIAWSFVKGHYLYRAYLNDMSFKDELNKVYSCVEMEDGSLWFLHNELLFTVDTG